MARPIKQGIEYFSHDVTMSTNEKLERLEHRRGNDGYAIYNKILEKVYASSGNFNILSDNDYELYGTKWHVGKDKLIEILSDMRELGLFPEENFLSRSLKERIKRIQAERKRQRNYKRNNTVKENIINAENALKTPVKQSYYTPKEKESKVKEIKEKQREGSPGELKLTVFDISLKDFCVELLKDSQYLRFDLRFYYEKIKSWAKSSGAVKCDWIATAKKFMLDDLQTKKEVRSSPDKNYALVGCITETDGNKSIN